MNTITTAQARILRDHTISTPTYVECLDRAYAAHSDTLRDRIELLEAEYLEKTRSGVDEIGTPIVYLRISEAGRKLLQAA